MKKKKVLWITLFIIGTLPFLIALVGCLNAANNGFAFLWGPAEYGLEAFGGYLLLFSYLFWPGYIIGLLLIIVAIIFLVRAKE